MKKITVLGWCSWLSLVVGCGVNLPDPNGGFSVNSRTYNGELFVVILTDPLTPVTIDLSNVVTSGEAPFVISVYDTDHNGQPINLLAEVGDRPLGGLQISWSPGISGRYLIRLSDATGSVREWWFNFGLLAVDDFPPQPPG